MEELLIAYLAGALDVEVYGAVPEERPDSFVTVERVGGSYSAYLQRASFAVQWWADSFAEAAALADTGCTALALLEYDENYPHIARVSLASGASPRFIDPDSGHARYQTSCEIIAAI